MLINPVPDFDDRYLINSDFLSHYCKSSTAIEHILAKGKLRFSSLIETNDPIEIIKKEFLFRRYIKNRSHNDKDKFTDLTTKLQWSISNTKIACFCQNRRHNARNDELAFQKGYLRTRMWAQYGENHQGVCIILNKAKLIKQCRNYLSDEANYRLQLKKGSVAYTNTVIRLPKIYTIHDSDLSLTSMQFFNKNEKYFFRTKFLDFKDEKEFRIAIIPHGKIGVEKQLPYPDIYIDISNCIEGIICGFKFKEVYKQLMADYARKFKVNSYQLNFKNGFPGFDKI